jgi:membrane-bound lytic murein transglycosylase D
MIRAVNDQVSYEKIFKNYNGGYFKFASKNFYSEFLAAIKVARRLEKSPNIVIDSAQSTQYFKLPGYINVKDAGKYFKISTETIISLNPALQPPIISGEKRIPKGYSLRLPAGKNIKQLVASFPARLYNTKQSPTLFHLVKKGDTAGSIARQHGVSLKKIMSANNLDESGKIYLNQKLKIPKQPASTLKTKTNIPKITAHPDAKKFTSGRRSTTPIILLANKKQEFDSSANQ